MFSKFDTIFGTVAGRARGYSVISCEEESDAEIRCGAFLPIGMTGYFTITKYIISEKTTYYAELDSAMYDAA